METPNNGLQCFFDAYGDVWTTDGVLIQPSTGVTILIGKGKNHVVPRSGTESFLTAFPVASGSTFAGGSGRNLVVTGLTEVESGPAMPIGFFRPQEPGFFRNLTGFEIEVVDATTATISDGTDVVAIYSDAAAPVGEFVGTTYGEDTYNGGDPFTLTVEEEVTGGGALPTFFLNVTGGTVPTGDLTVIDAATYELDADWSLTIDAAGTAQLRYLGDVVAVRADGSGFDPLGTYEAVEAAWDWNMVPDEDEVDQPTPWSAIVEMRGRTPRAGFSYVIVHEDSAGTVTGVSGPFFGALPTLAVGEQLAILAQSDGLGGLEQYHTGALVWSAPKQVTWGTVASSTDSGIEGQVRVDGTHIQVCVASDTWGRLALDLTPWP